jgi:hypothetical protein
VSLSQNSAAISSLRKFADGFFSLPTVSSLEGFFLRLLFGLVIASTLSLQVPFHDQPHPVGLARFFDLTWLADPEKLSAYRSVLYLLLLIYASGWFLPIVLPLLAVGYSLMFTLYNSQGYTHHGYQILSLTLLVQAVTVIYYSVLKGLRLQPPDALLNSWLLVQSQVVVTGTYLVSFLTKLFATGAMWFWNAHYIALDMIKTQRQHYFSRFNPADLGDPPEAIWLLEHPWLARGLFASGVVLEAIAFFALASRRLSFFIAVGLILMHRSVSMLMGLRFQNNEMLCAVFLIGIPYFIASCLQRVHPVAVRIGLLIGAGVGIPLSYFAQPAAIQNAMPFSYYLVALVNSLSVWANGNWGEMMKFTLPVWTTCLITAAAGALGARIIDKAKMRPSVG